MRPIMAHAPHLDRAFHPLSCFTGGTGIPHLQPASTAGGCILVGGPESGRHELIRSLHPGGGAYRHVADGGDCRGLSLRQAEEKDHYTDFLKEHHDV